MGDEMIDALKEQSTIIIGKYIFKKWSENLIMDWLVYSEKF